MNVELLDQWSTHSPDEAPAFAARVCYSEEDPTDTSFEDMISGVAMDKEVFSKEEQHNKLLKQLIRRGHYSVFEHPKAVFAIEGVSRATMAQITRHRHMSFSVQSQRYCDFSEGDVVSPPSYEELDDVQQREVKHFFAECFEMYDMLTSWGVPEEDARMVLPIGTKVNMIVSGNPRAWMHVLDMRHAGDAQWEIRDLSESIIEQLKEWAPKTFGYYEDYAKGASKKAP